MLSRVGFKARSLSTKLASSEIGKRCLDPIGKFEATMTGCTPETFERFYYGNIAALLGTPA